MKARETAISTEHVAYSYGSHQVLSDVQLEIPKGKYISIVGPNGSGKTTLFNLLCGVEKPGKGIVTFEGQDVYRMDLRERARRFAVIHQHEDNSFPFTCVETVILGLHPHRNRFEKLTDRHLEEVRKVMEMTDTWQFADKLITQTSGGEMQRVILARALMQSPQVLFMDEAMSDMDVHAKIKMIKLLKRLVAEEGLTVIAINHDINTAYQFSDEIIALKQGGVRVQGDPGQVMTEAFFADVFRVRVEIVPNKGVFIEDNIEEEETLS